MFVLFFLFLFFLWHTNITRMFVFLPSLFVSPFRVDHKVGIIEWWWLWNVNESRAVRKVLAGDSRRLGLVDFGLKVTYFTQWFIILGHCLFLSAFFFSLTPPPLFKANFLAYQPSHVIGLIDKFYFSIFKVSFSPKNKNK